MKNNKKGLSLFQKTVLLSASSLMLLGALSTNTALPNTHALYNDNNKLVGHGFDALSTKNGLNKPDKGTVSLPLITGLKNPKLEKWKGSFSFSDQNGDSIDNELLSLYPGETFHMNFTIKYIGDPINPTKVAKSLGSTEFITFRSDLFNYISQPKLTASNASTNATIKTKLDNIDDYVYTQISLSATQIQPGDEFSVDLDLQTVLNLKEKVLADTGEFPYYYNALAALRVDDSGSLTYTRGLGWTQTEATSKINKKQLDTNTYQMELTNTTKGSLFNQTIHNSMLMDAKNIKITGLEQIHTDKNPVVDYVDLSMNKGTQITTNGTASLAQLDAVNKQLQAGNFVIDEVQEGDKVVVTYEIIG